VCYEVPQQYEYDDWIFAQAFFLGHACPQAAASISLSAPAEKETARAVRDRVKTLASRAAKRAYDDKSYSCCDHNCWDFCHDLLCALRLPQDDGAMERHNDRLHKYPKGTTKAARRALTFLLRHWPSASVL
jgi:hypothetical protein